MLILVKALRGTGEKLLGTLIASSMGPTRGPPGADRTQVDPMLAPWTLIFGYLSKHNPVIDTCVTRFPWHYLSVFSLQWRHNEHGGVSNNRRPYYLLNRLFRHRSNKTSKYRVTGLCQRASNTENVSIWWRHYGFLKISISRTST